MNKITFPLKLRMKGAKVADLQDALKMCLDRRAILANDAAARRELSAALKPERNGQTYGSTTRKLVSIFQQEQRLFGPTGAPSGEVDEPTANALNAMLKELGLLDQPVEPAPPGYSVEGKVASRISAGVGGLRVQIVDKGVGDDVHLADAVTEDGGAYRATFSDKDIRRRGKTRPDLQARVFAGDTFLAASEVRYNASQDETLNVLLDDKASSALRSEHEILTGALAGHFAGRLGDLKETDDRQDITYLANKTGWDARAVALAALADQFSARTVDAAGAPAIPQPFFYALFRAGLPANEHILYRTDAKTLTMIWTKAVAQGVIPSSITSTIPGVVKQFQKLGAKRLLTGSALAGVSSLKEMLASSRLSDTQQQRFAALYTANGTDMASFWKAVGDAFGRDTAGRLQLDGKLGFLTMNNVPLMQALRRVGGSQGLSDPVQIAQAGFHRAAKWGELLNANTPIPKEIPGETPEAKRGNYAEFLAAQVRLSYPTAALAEMVKSGGLPVSVPDQVHGFLTEHQGQFEIGVQPVERYIAQKRLQVAPETVAQIKRLQRVYQITPGDRAMTGLLKRGIDAAYHVVRFDKEAFVQKFSQDLGGADQAALVYKKSQQVHNAVLNIVISYLTARNGVELGAPPMMQGTEGSRGEGRILRPAPTAPSAENGSDIIAYPTLESLFGSLDFCACDHCRSVLSPAAYLVDLLHFIDRDPTEAGKENPQAVLLERRPDIQHLPLTCENTNTALPYIDVVNETLEYFAANSVQPLSLKDYTGHDTNGVASEDLMASPQFVMESAYAILRGERFPLPLPFHQPLENLRRIFDKFEVPLPLAMERLRKTDDLERAANPYGWRDILMEELGLSREEHEILTDSAAVPLWRMYGFPNAAADPDVIAVLSNAKVFARRVGISYDDLVSLLRTRFINPNSDLIPKLERLGVPFATLQALHDGTLTDQAFDAVLPTGTASPDPARYGGDINAWVKNAGNFKRIMAIITLADPGGSSDGCSFDALEFRYSKPMTGSGDTSTRLGAVEFLRLLRFIRLWRKTGWTVEQTDAAICALYRPDLAPLAPENIDAAAKLDGGFLTLLPRLGIVVRVMKALNVTPDRGLLPLLACWSDIGTHGDGALYRRMFLSPALLKLDDAFADDGFGEFLTDNTQHLAAHAEALRAAFLLTDTELSQITAALGFDADTSLTVGNISAVFRRGWLARKLKLSAREFLLLTKFTGLDPFAAPDPPNPPILRLTELMSRLRAASLKPAQPLYLIWNQDISGKSSPGDREMMDFARSLRAGFAAIESEFAVDDDPEGQIARARMALVYGNEATDLFFGLLGNTFVTDVPYSHGQATLEQPILNAGLGRIAYDDFRKRISFTGVLTTTARDALKVGVPLAFENAVDKLYEENQKIIGPFFARYPELLPLYNAYVASNDPAEKKRSALLANFLPELKRRRKRQQALQAIGTAAGTDVSFAGALLDNKIEDHPEAKYLLHATASTSDPALADLNAIETAGLSAQFFFRDTATGNVDLASDAEASLAYSATGPNKLPANPVPGAAISGIWRGYLEAPGNGFFNFFIEGDAGTIAGLTLGGIEVNLAESGSVWSNTAPIELRAGTLYAITLKVEGVKDTLLVRWESDGRGREIIPPRYQYSATLIDRLRVVYIRFLKAASLASGLRLTAAETVHLASHRDYRIGGQGWLNSLPDTGSPNNATAPEVLRAFIALLDFARIKRELAPDDERFLSILKDPAAATRSPDGLLFVLTHWTPDSLSALLNQFGKSIADLRHLDTFCRIYDAYAPVKTMGIPASALIKAATNEPNGITVRDLQAALRASYDQSDWLNVLKPINDEMRGLQRDALVAYILHGMRLKDETKHIDTPDKLFEYFLMDVQMDPCMQTSRIRHALSTVQLFIERCLMNLETRVSPSSINSGQWEWMKRYRVWEANRKVFLWPENWLEPELRDDKSPFFKEMESELLQGDITEDSATTALLNYLSKLEEVAKLEPCGIHYVEPTETHGKIIHLVARTAGAHRKYYYRRYEFGCWTTWEQIKLDIEDNPVIPVVWKDRLLLFWLRLLKSGPDTANMPPAGKALTDLRTNDLPGDPQITVKAMLCWSEFYNDKWQPTKTSDLNLPTTLGASLPNGFDRGAIRLGVTVEGDALRVYMRDTPIAFYERGSDGLLHLVEIWPGSFLLYNTHSLPSRGDDEVAPVPPASPPVRRRVFAGNPRQDFALKYSDPVGGDFTREILKTQMAFELIDPRHDLQDTWDAPVFFGDSRHVFLVTTEEKPVWVRNYGGYGIFDNPGMMESARIPPLVVQPPPPRPKFRGDGGPMTSPLGIVDPAPMRRFVTEDVYIHQGLGTTLNIQYGDHLIGPSGAIPKDSAEK